MNRDAFVRGIVIGLRTQMNPKYPVDPSQLREIREQAEVMADQIIEHLDDTAQQVFIGMCRKLGHAPKGELFESYCEQAKIVSAALSTVPKAVRGQPAAPVDPERDEFKKSLTREIIIQVRAGMDLRERLTPERCMNLRWECEDLAEQLMEENLDTREVVIGICGHTGSVAKAQVLADFIEQGRLVGSVLSAPRKTPPKR
jgi:hypothetical protein